MVILEQIRVLRRPVRVMAFLLLAGTASVAVPTRIAGQETPSDRERLEDVLAEWGPGNARLELLESIPTAAQSRELRAIAADLVDAREQLSILRDRYTDDALSIQALLTRIALIEGRAIPTVLSHLIESLPPA